MSNELSRQQQWNKVLEITEQLKEMLDLDGEDWELMSSLVTQRQQLLNTYFENPLSAEEAESIATEMQEIIHSTEEMLQDGRNKQISLIGAVQQISTNRQAIHAYNKIQK